MTETLEIGRAASEHHAWTEAVEAYTTADRESALSPDDLRSLGHARWWSGQPDEATEAFERAFAGYMEAGRPGQAAEVAMELAYRAFRGLKGSVGGGWLGQAARLLGDIPESSSHAWLAVFEAFNAIIQTRYVEGIELVDAAIAVARRTNNPSVLSRDEPQGLCAAGERAVAGRHAPHRRGGGSSRERPAGPSRGKRHLLHHDRRLPGGGRPGTGQPVG